MTTHNLDEADRLCDRIGVFKSRLLVIDSPANLRTQLFGRKVVFHLRQADEKLASLIEGLPFVREARLIDDKLVVTLDDPEAHNPEMVRTLVGAGAEIVFVGELRRSLEDVYLQLIKNATDYPGADQQCWGRRPDCRSAHPVQPVLRDRYDFRGMLPGFHGQPVYPTLSNDAADHPD